MAPDQKTAIDPEHIISLARNVFETEARAIAMMPDLLSDAFCNAVSALMACNGRVIISGMGKSGHIARKIVATLASTGTPSHYVHPAEASHGDLGMVTDQDVVILISNSGESKELADIIAHTRRFNIPMIAITKKAQSTLAQQADHILILPNAPEACAIGLAPTTSTTCTLALGDALAVVLMKLKQFHQNDFFKFHPGGKLGSQLVKASTLMHVGAAVPMVDIDTAMSDTLLEMTSKGFGVSAVLKEGRLHGIVTDGDLRRNMLDLTRKTAGQVCSTSPTTINSSLLAGEALALMNQKSISCLFITSEDGAVEGIIHIHDCIRAGIV